MRNCLSTIIILTSLCVSKITTFNFPADKFYNNGPCVIESTGEQGVCKESRYCTALMHSIRTGIRPTVCYFVQFEAIVCCPTYSYYPPAKENIGNIESTAYFNNSKDVNVGGTSQPEIEDDDSNERLSDEVCRDTYFPFQITVVGGEKAEKGEYPYMTAIGWKNSEGEIDFRCGGFLVDPSFVITAAHCTKSFNQSPSVVRVGGNNLDNPEGNDVNIDISEIIIHPQYSPPQLYNDIAILKLAEPIKDFTPACLWSNAAINYTTVTAIGYGHTQFGGSSSKDLLKVNLTVFENQFCSQYYNRGELFPNGLQNTQVCAGDLVNIKDTCQGDSGGPIVVKIEISKKIVPYILGVTSTGKACASRTPSIYTKISSYLDWIEKTIWSSY